jgi:hypothetical protein
MRAFRPNATRSEADLPASPEALVEMPERPGLADHATGEVVVASHEELFADPVTSQCDACGEPLAEDAGDGYDVPGRGAYLWARGEETRLETVPLCASCASAIGMTALARWEIEEEEG